MVPLAKETRGCCGGSEELTHPICLLLGPCPYSLWSCPRSPASSCVSEAKSPLPPWKTGISSPLLPQLPGPCIPVLPASAPTVASSFLLMRPLAGRGSRVLCLGRISSLPTPQGPRNSVTLPSPHPLPSLQPCPLDQ